MSRWTIEEMRHTHRALKTARTHVTKALCSTPLIPPERIERYRKHINALLRLLREDLDEEQERLAAKEASHP